MWRGVGWAPARAYIDIVFTRNSSANGQNAISNKLREPIECRRRQQQPAAALLLCAFWEVGCCDFDFLLRHAIPHSPTLLIIDSISFAIFRVQIVQSTGNKEQSVCT